MHTCWTWSGRCACYIWPYYWSGMQLLIISCLQYYTTARTAASIGAAWGASVHYTPVADWEESAPSSPHSLTFSLSGGN